MKNKFRILMLFAFILFCVSFLVTKYTRINVTLKDSLDSNLSTKTFEKEIIPSKESSFYAYKDSNKTLLKSHIPTKELDHILDTILEKKNNIKFNIDDTFTKIDTRDLISSLKIYLDEAKALRDIQDQNIIKDPPIIIKKRMIAIDLLEKLAKSTLVSGETQTFASDILGEIIIEELPKDESLTVQRIFLAEKYDALVALTRVDKEHAKIRFLNLDERIQPQLRPAILRGLIDLGITSLEAKQWLELSEKDEPIMHASTEPR